LGSRREAWVAGAAHRWDRLSGRILRVPLFFKILVANVVVVSLGAVGGTWLAAEASRADPSASTAHLAVLFGLAGGGAIGLVNWMILRLALKPLSLLEATAARVREGAEGARVPPSALADRQMERVRVTFNSMLSTLEAYRSRLRALNVRAHRSTEEERHRIVRGLHDHTVQRLVGLHLRLQTFGRMEDPEGRRGVLDEVLDGIEAATADLRRLALQLRPVALEELGLGVAVRGYAREQADRSGTPVDVQGEAGRELPQDVALEAYRIVQEGVRNAVRHARASRVEVRLLPSGDRLIVEVGDDGAGFAVEEILATPGRGLGLWELEERAAALGGRLRIESTPGRGTRLTAELPLAPDAARPFSPLPPAPHDGDRAGIDGPPEPLHGSVLPPRTH
jgi:two-component system, NarL family, sensor histidine kinase UhpB